MSFKNSKRKFCVYSVIFTFIVLLFTNLNPALETSNLKDLDDRPSEKNTYSYIIEFKEKSVLSLKNELREKVDNKLINLGSLKLKIEDHRFKLKSLHQRAKDKIINLLGEGFSTERIITHDFTLLSNSIVVENIPEDVAKSIRSLPYVQNIRLDSKISICSDNPLSWGVNKIKADEVWKINDLQGRKVTGKNISIAILDTGIDYHHYYFGGGFGQGYKVVDGYDYVRYNRYEENNDTYWDYQEPNDDPDDRNGHGTHCAGIALGVAPGAHLYSYRIMNDDGWGKESWFLEGMTRALDPNGDEDTSDHVDVISLSLGDPTGNPNDNLSEKVNEVVDAGVVVCVSAGNDGPVYGTINSPGCAEKAITVGATDINDHIFYSSSRGPTSTGQIKPDVVAPGVNVKSTYLNNQTATGTGTSMAAPHVAGAAALILQYNPSWSPSKIKNALKNKAVKIDSFNGIEYDENTQGAGRVDVFSTFPSAPIAILDIPQIVEKGVIEIKGTALNGTGNPSDFVNYTLSYKSYESDSNWIKIYENQSEVGKGILYNWDITDFEPGFYDIKLVVHNKNMSASDISSIDLFGENLNIFCNKSVFEKQKFTVRLFNEYFEPVKAIVIFLSGFHIPQISYGSTIKFTSPNIINPLKDKIKGKIIAIKILDSEVTRKEITIENV